MDTFAVVALLVLAVSADALDTIADSSNSVSEVEDAPMIDDFTTHGLERLSSAATCLVAGVEYTHGQQIYRADQCEFCLCLDGEMFCWWQDCPPTMEGPCKDRGPFTPCLNIPLSEVYYSSSSSSTTTTTTKGSSSENPPISEGTDLTTDRENNTTDAFSDDNESNSTEETIMTVTEQHGKFCLMMGRKYEVGDKLPHDTGNCVECICGPGAKVTCSPHECAPAGEDINDYRPPGPRQQLPDVF